MDSEIVKKDLDLMVQKIMEKEGIKKYTIQIEGQTSSGDNYLADVIFFNVKSGEHNKVYKLVMKTAKRSEEMRKVLPVGIAYDREIFTYSIIFQTYRDFVLETNCDITIDFLPKLYGVESEVQHETLILENMKASGYKLWDRTKPWTLEHSLLAMKNYGKLHGLSFALKARKPEIFENFSKKLPSVGAEFGKTGDVQQFYEDSWKAVVDIMKKADREDLVRKYEGFHSDFGAVMCDNTPQEDKLVICHGDCWNNNFMFKSKNETDDEPDKICFLDFQLVSLDTPIKDLSYNIYSTCDKFGLDHFDLLLETYYKSMSDTVKSLGSNLEDMFTYEDLMVHWKKYAKFGLIFAMVVIKLCLVSKSKAPDLEKLSKIGKEMSESISVEKENEEEHSRRILDIVTHFADRCL